MNNHAKKTLLALLAGLVMVTLIGCGGTTTPEKATTQNGENQKPKAPETFLVGEPIKMGGLIFTVNSVRDSKGGEFLGPEEGYIYKIVDVTLDNVGEESASISSLLMFSLNDTEGYKYDVTIATDTKGSVDGELQPGRKLRGELAFEVPEDVVGLELLFEPNVFGFGQAIVKIN